MENSNIAEKILFAKEAAEYLGISVQRLFQLVNEGKIIPIKKSSAGTLFIIDELEKRKAEMAIFDSTNKMSQMRGEFEINTKIRQEAVNFATVIEITKRTEPYAEQIFNELSKRIDVSVPLPQKAKEYSIACNATESEVVNVYNSTYKCFTRLKKTDEIIKRGEDNYPILLSKTEQAPRFLYLRGNAELLNNRIVSVVGSRQASEDGKKRAAKLARILGMNGITIASGLAKGIDVSAHIAALHFGFNTISVIGTELNKYYPKENESVQKEIETKGLVVSQFSPASTTQRWHFPLRNSVMSGLSLATIIVEAGETSGALKQADYALKQKRLVLIPKSAVDNEQLSWPKKYAAREGAVVVKNTDEIIEALSKMNIFEIEISRNQIDTQISIFE